MKQIFTDELDFDVIKNNIKVFLSAQSEFTDYNFEGSVMSTLLDILAWLYGTIDSVIQSFSKCHGYSSVSRDARDTDPTYGYQVQHDRW